MVGALAVLGAPVAAQEGYEPIAYGETVSNFLTADDPIFDLDSTTYKIYGFDGVRGDTITIHLSSEDFNSQLIVTDEAGNPLADDMDSGGNCNAYVTTILPDSGFYIVYVNGTYSGELGQFQLTLQHGLQPPGSTEQCRGLTVLGHRGTVWIDGAVEGSLGEQSYTFRNEYFDVWLLPQTRGKVFTIDVISEDFDPAVILFRGLSEQITYNDDGAGGCNSRIVHTPANMRPYRIVVISRGERKPGSYILRVSPGSKPLLTEPPCGG
jgi:serine protease Do